MEEEGVIICLGLLDMDQCAIRAVLSQRPAKQQATVSQGGGHASVPPHRYAKTRPKKAGLCSKATHRIRHFTGGGQGP